jgi:hypothetical protein
MICTINAEQLSATSDKTRDARSVSMRWKNPGGFAYAQEKRIEHDSNGERTRGLQRIVPTKTAIQKVDDATMLVDGTKIWTEQGKVLLAERKSTETVSPAPGLLPPTSAECIARRSNSLLLPSRTKR